MKSLLLFLLVLALPIMSRGQEAQPPREYQNPQEYVQALNTALALYQQKKITSLQFEDVFFPVGKMQFFLSYNYDNPVVADLLQRIQKARVSEAIIDNVPDVLSGKRKQMDISLRKNHPELAQPVPLLAGGSSPTDPAPNVTPDPMSATVWRSQNPNATPPPGMLKPPSSKVASTPRPSATATPAVATEKPSSNFPVVPLVILAAVIAGAAVFFLRRKP